MGNNHIRYSDQCQQARSLAMPWALCRQTSNAQNLDIAVMAKCHTKKINSFFQTTQTITIWYPRFACGAPILSRRVSEMCCVAHNSDSNRKTWNERADISQVPYENQIAKQLRGNSRIISSLILSWLHKLYALQRVLHYRVNIYANERRVWHRLAVTMFLGFHIAESGVPTLLRELLSLSLVSWSSAVRMLN